MIKTFLLTVLAVLSLIKVDAQKSSYVGVHFGANINSAYGSAIASEKRASYTGINIGADFTRISSKHFVLKASLQYEQMGWAYHSLYFEDNSGNTIGKGDLLYKSSYVSLPILANYSFGHKINFTLGGGLFASALLDSKLKMKLKEGSSQTATAGNSEARKRFNYGIVTNAGAQIPITKKITLNLDVRNVVGIANIYKSPTTYNNTIRTRSVSFLSGVSFYL
jgi:hypothetical protein